LILRRPKPERASNFENHSRRSPTDPCRTGAARCNAVREGSLDQAVRKYERLAADHPYFAPATRALALLMGNAPLTPRKRSTSQQSAQAYPDDPDVAKTLGI